MDACERYHTHISARHNWLDLKLNEVWQYRDLVLLFTKRSLAVSYKQTILGPLWLLLRPLLTSVMLTLVFGHIAGIGTDGVPRLLFYLCGNAMWAYFAACLTTNSSTFVSNAGLFGKVYFPRMAVPLSNLLTAAIKLAVQLGLVEDRTVPVYDTSEDLRLRFRLQINRPLKRVQLRIIFHTAADQPVGTAWTEPADFPEPGETEAVYRFPLNALSRGVLYASIGFCRMNDGGGMVRLDHVDHAFKVELTTRLGYRYWNARTYGAVKLPGIVREG